MSAPAPANIVDWAAAGRARREANPGPFVDRFSEPVPVGRAVGSRTSDGIVRRGVDREGVIGVDHGALRIQPLIKPGWARSGIAYGPFAREAGLAFHALVLNGHNISRTEPLPDGFRMRLWRWLVGPEVEASSRRVIQWLKGGHKRHMWRRLRQWLRSGSGVLHWPWIEESFAVGWFPSEAPTVPLRQGSGVAVHAVVPEGGELWARVGHNSAPVVRGLQNLPLYYTVVLREQGAAYYVSSPIGAPGIPRFPHLRLVAIDALARDEVLYAGVHQSVLGEIGFRVDTRVYGTQVARLPGLSTWFGTAHGADTMVGAGPLAPSPADVGGSWSALEGQLLRTDRGVIGERGGSAALLKLDSTTGLIHMSIDCGAGPVDGVAVLWRAADEHNYWCFEVGSDHGQLAVVENGSRHDLVRTTGRHLPPNTVSALEIYDDGDKVLVRLNGRQICETSTIDRRAREAAGVGVRIVGACDAAVRSFEAHPRDIRIASLLDLGGPQFPIGSRIVVADDFDGPPSDLDGRATGRADVVWQREIGRGVIELTGHRSARVRASAQQPCPGRTAYTVPWANAEFADVEVTITPPGRSRGTGEKGRSGLILWQDPDNYMIISAFVEDWPAMSIAAFFRIDGFEELFDAVWTNVGSRMHWGEPHALRVAFDGQAFTAYLNGEPILYRALSDVYPDCKGLKVHRVGLVANWEWGNDTGSSFQSFVGRVR